MRIVHVLKNLGLGGTEKTAQLFCEYLARYTTHEVILLFGLNGHRDRYDQFAKFMSGMLPFTDERSCKDLIAGLSPDIVHLYRSGFPEWPHPGVDGPAYIETNVFGQFDPRHGLDASIYMSQWLHDAVMNSGLRKIKDRFRRSFHWINNPVKPPATTEKFDVGNHDVVLGRCGRPDNGVYDDIAVKGSWLLQQAGTRVKWLMMGAPPAMVADLDSYGIPYQIIQPTSEDRVLSKFYNSIDILAHSRPDGESAGSNLFEAAYHGKPIISHVAVPSHPGMGVFQNQTTVANVVVGHSAPEYFRGLQGMLADKEHLRLLGEYNVSRAELEFDWRVCGLRLVEIYDQVLKDKANGSRSDV